MTQRVRAIIPAAGVGTRLQPLTDSIPKCLVEIAGVSLIARALRRLERAGVSDVVVVTGYRADQLVDSVQALCFRPPVTFVHNADYRTSDNIVSLLETASFWGSGDVLVLDADVLFAQRLVDTMVGAAGDLLAVDTAAEPARIDMAIELRDGAAWHLGKDLPPDRVHGEFFGMSRWSREGGRSLIMTVQEMVASGEVGTWYPFAIRRLAKAQPVGVVETLSGEWLEIDGLADLERAELEHGRGFPWARDPGAGGSTETE